MSSKEYSPGEGRQYFERPDTLFNRTLRFIADRRPHAELTQEDIERLRDDSLAVFSTIAFDHEALEKIRTEVDWYMAEESCPSMVLSGEVTVDDDGAEPEARFFRDAPVLAIGSDSGREAGLLGAADHFVGHLYAYFTGASDYDEHAAVYWQNRAAVARFQQGDSRFRFRPFFNVLAYKRHKQIPYEVYSPRSLPLMGNVGRGGANLEVCELRYPEVQGWSRLSARVAEDDITTSYRRSIPLIKEGAEIELASQDLGSEGSQLWSVVVTDSELGVNSVIVLTKEGRPQKSDLELVGDLEKHLRVNGFEPQDSHESGVGGIKEVVGL